MNGHTNIKHRIVFALCWTLCGIELRILYSHWTPCNRVMRETLIVENSPHIAEERNSQRRRYEHLKTRRLVKTFLVLYGSGMFSTEI